MLPRKLFVSPKQKCAVAFVDKTSNPRQEAGMKVGKEPGSGRKRKKRGNQVAPDWTIEDITALRILADVRFLKQTSCSRKQEHIHLNLVRLLDLVQLLAPSRRGH